MKPITKLNTYVFAITISVIYYLSNYLNDCLSIIRVKNHILEFIIVFISSIVSYKGVYEIILIACKHVQLLRKLILGKSFFEGTWIGYYKYKNEIHLTYSIYTQSIDEFSIQGWAFDLKGKEVCRWTVVEPYIDIQKCQLSYFYEINDSDISDFYMGYSNSTIIFDKHKKPCKFKGFAVDGDDSTKQLFTSIKESDNPGGYVNNQKYLFQKAYNLYENEELS